MNDDQSRPPRGTEDDKKPGFFSRYPRLGIIIIGLLFILPICAMVITVFVLIAARVLNA